MEEEKEIESDRGCIGTSDPFRYDPVFRSRAELKRYFKEDSSDSDPDPGDCGGDDGQVLAVGGPAAGDSNPVCTCGGCEDIVSKEGWRHRCCQECRELWSPKQEKGEKVNCVTDSIAYKASMNPHAIRFGLKYNISKVCHNFLLRNIYETFSR